MRKLLPALILLISLGGCRKKDLPIPDSNTPPVSKGVINIKVENFVGERALVVGDTSIYTLPNGNKFSVSLYNYYLTNFVFIDDSGNRYAEKESYHLTKGDSAHTLEFKIKDVPPGNYTTIEFLIGVDSVRNFSGAQVGALDPINHMIWSWNSGYIMAKMEGEIENSLLVNNFLSYHIAGFKGEYNVIKKIRLSLPSNARVQASKEPSIILRSDLATWFAAPNFPGFAALQSVGSEGPEALKIAQNYSKMMSVSKVENQ